MSENEKDKGIFYLQGNVVQIGNPTKSGGRFITITTGSDLVKVFYGPDQVAKIPTMMGFVKLALGMPRDGFITAQV